MNSLAIIKKQLVVYALVVLLFWGCTVTEPEPMQHPTDSATRSFTLTIQLETATHTHTPSPINTQTQSPTNTATILTQVSSHPIEIEPVSTQFAAIRQNCPLPQGSAMDTVPPNCLHTGLFQGDFLNFGRLSQYHTLRITYLFTDGSELPGGFIDTIHLAVFKFLQSGNYQAEPVLFQALLQHCDQNPAIIFSDLDVDDLQETGYLAFYVALRQNDGHIFRADPILFYEPPAPTLTVTPIPTPLPTQAPSTTNTPLPMTPTITPTPTWDWG